MIMLPDFVTPELLLSLSAIVMVITALTHSVLGEKKLIQPLLMMRYEDKANIMFRRRARKVLRFAWHFTSLFMVLTALLIIWPDVPIALIALTGALWFFAGIFDAIYTRGKHIGWPLLTAAGALALAAVYLLTGLTL